MYTKIECETIVNFNEDESHADIYTASLIQIRRLDKLCAAHPETYQCTGRDEHSATYKCPMRQIRFAKPSQPMSDEQREAARERALKNFGTK